jgi:hypothetical protein
MFVSGFHKSGLCVAGLAIVAANIAIGADDPRRIDVDNLFPTTGALVIWAGPNNAGVPPGILAIATGTLIHERVFLTCGHCTRASEPGIPPFIKAYVTFSLHVMDDPSTWIPVTAQAWHPSTLPCGPDNACHWPDEPFPRPGLSDVGLVLLAKPVKSVKPVKLAPAGSLYRGRGGTEDQALVGYLYPEGIRRYSITSPATIFDDRWVQGGAGEACAAVAGFASGSIQYFGPISESGRKRRTALGTISGFSGRDCARGRSGLARLENADVLSWIDQQMKQWLEPGR